MSVVNGAITAGYVALVASTSPQAALDRMLQFATGASSMLEACKDPSPSFEVGYQQPSASFYSSPRIHQSTADIL